MDFCDDDDDFQYLLEGQAGTLYETRPIAERWTLGAEIGKGGFGAVHLANSVENRMQVAAVKVVDRRNASRDTKSLRMIRSEVLCLARVHEAGGHPNIVKVYEICEDAKNIYIVLEHLDGGELFSLLANMQSVFTESDSAFLLYHVLSAVAFLHEIGICHRDIKPENLMFCKGSGVSGVKLIDFGVSFCEEDANLMNRLQIGSALYLPPENIYGEPYTYLADIWSVGIIAFICLTGSLPYDLSLSENLLDVVLEFGPSFDLSDFQRLSPVAQDFVRQMLNSNKEARPTAEDLLKHEWLQKFVSRNARKEQCSRKREISDRVIMGIEPIVQIRSLEMKNMRMSVDADLLQKRRLEDAVQPQFFVTTEGSDHISVHSGSAAHKLLDSAGNSTNGETAPVPDPAKLALTPEPPPLMPPPAVAPEALHILSETHTPGSSWEESEGERTSGPNSLTPIVHVQAVGLPSTADSSPLVRKFGYGTALWSARNMENSQFHIPSLLETLKINHVVRKQTLESKLIGDSISG